MFLYLLNFFHLSPSSEFQPYLKLTKRDQFLSSLRINSTVLYIYYVFYQHCFFLY